jgi:hypothetical protein
LRTPSGPGDSARFESGNVMRSRLSRFRRGDFRTLLMEAWAADRAAREAWLASGAAPGQPVELDEEARLRRQAKKCCSLVAAGELSRGLKALLSDDSLAAITPLVVEKLRLLHPAQLEALDVEALSTYQPPAAARIAVTTEAVVEALRSAPRKSSAGCSGLTYDHLRDAVLDDETLAAQLTTLVQRLGDGSLPPAAAELLADSRLIPLEKPDGGIRPIAIGDVLRRLSARILLRHCRDAIDEHFAPHQVGVGLRCGAEAVVRSAVAFSEANRGHARIQLDFKNAFNRMCRRRMFDSLKAHPVLCGLIPFVRVFYAGQPHLRLAAEEDDELLYVPSRTGSQQGDVMGSLLYAAPLQPLVLELLKQAGYDAFFCDDGTLGVKVEDVPAVLAFLGVEIDATGGELNLTKTVVYWDYGVLPPAVVATGVKCIDLATPPLLRGHMLLGAPVGSPEYQAAQLDEIVATTERDLQRIATYLADVPQTAVLLLRKCIIPRSGYLSRCLPPTLTNPALERFDAAVLACQPMVTLFLYTPRRTQFLRDA